MLVLDWKERAFIETVNSKCFCYYQAAILVDQKGAPIWRLHTKLCRGAWNILANNSETMGAKTWDLDRLFKILSLITWRFCPISWERQWTHLFFAQTIHQIHSLCCSLRVLCTKPRRDTSKADKNSLSLSCTTTTTMKFTLLRVLLDQMWNLFTVPNQIKG